MPATTEHFVSGPHSIPAEVFSPSGPGRHPGCLILHGTFGLLPEYRADILSFGEALAQAGLVAMVPHYFEATGTPAGLPATHAIPVHLEEWLATCGHALGFLRTHPQADPGRLGAIGFSLGGHVVLRLAMDPPAGTTLKGVVDFFGPTSAPRLHGNRAVLPPVQIHHGTDDPLVPISDSTQLVSQLRSAGKVEHVGYEFFTYHGQGHGFTEPALSASRTRAVEFISGVM
jgi:dienelactone hydrolase